MRRVHLFLLLSGASACSLFTPLSGFSSGQETSTPDGATEAGTTVDVVGTNDVSPFDQEAAPSPPVFCAKQPGTLSLCMDFDDGATSPPSGWTLQLEAPGGVEVTSSPTLSGTSALRAWVAPANKMRAAYWARPIGEIAVEHVRYSYALFVEERPTQTEAELCFLRFDSLNAQSYFYLALEANKATYWQQRSTTAGEDSVPIGGSLPIATGKWARISVEVTLTGTKQLVVTVDGTEIVREAINPLMTPGKPLIGAGVTWAAAAVDRAKVVIDDVAFEVLP